MSQRIEDGFPDTAMPPSHIAIINRRVRTVTVWQVSPRCACSQNVEDAIEDLTVIPAFRAASSFGKQRRNNQAYLDKKRKLKHKGITCSQILRHVVRHFTAVLSGKEVEVDAAGWMEVNCFMMKFYELLSRGRLGQRKGALKEW